MVLYKQGVKLTPIFEPVDLAVRLDGILELADRHCERSEKADLGRGRFRGGIERDEMSETEQPDRQIPRIREEAWFKRSSSSEIVSHGQ